MFQPIMNYAQLFLRIAIGVGYIYPVLDRFGVLGRPGEAGIYWGDWQHFLRYAQRLLFFLSEGQATGLAIAATIFESIFGVLLSFGFLTKWCSLGSGMLAFTFGICMWLAIGPSAPLGYSVFTLSAASFLLSAIPHHKWSFDAIIHANNAAKRTIYLIH